MMGVDLGGPVPASAPALSEIGDHFALHMEGVSRHFLGEPNRTHSSSENLRFGTNGSLAVNRTDGTWFDHENKVGGGVLDFIVRQSGGDRSDAAEWLEDFLNKSEAPVINIPKPDVNKPSRIVARYDYRDENGDLLFRVCRFEPKKFLQQAPDGTWSVKGIRQVPYRLPELLSRAQGTPIYVVEGEKDADRLAALGYVATCNAGGAGKWPDGLTEHFADADVRIIADNDEPGRKHAEMVCAALYAMARGVRIIELPNLPPKGDVSDWLDAGGGDLDEIADATALWKPEPIVEVVLPKKHHRAEYGFPAPLHADAYYGIVGEIAHAIEPHTEADPAALVLLTLAFAGTVVGRAPYRKIGGTCHHCNLFLSIVGNTGKSRKGTAVDCISSVFRQADKSFDGSNIDRGLSSGEGLVNRIRDGSGDLDPGVADKRLLVIEEEIASVIKRMHREGNTLGEIVRCAWDGKTLQTLTKNTPLKATRPHVSIAGNITKHELVKVMADTDASNGFANRFLWVAVKRSKELPFGGGHVDEDGLAKRLKGKLDLASRQIHYDFSQEARALWASEYSRLSKERPGLLGSVLGRLEAQAIRLAMLYAALDGSPGVIDLAHLNAALAVVDYAERSAIWIFADRMAHPLAEDTYDLLSEAGPKGLSRTELSNKFKRHKSATEISEALRSLAEVGRARVEIDRSTRRPTERWYIVD